MTSPYFTGHIHTDERGRPIADRPEPLSPDATVDEWVVWSRAVHAYNDAVTSYTSARFCHHLRKAWKA